MYALRRLPTNSRSKSNNEGDAQDSQNRCEKTESERQIDIPTQTFQLCTRDEVKMRIEIQRKFVAS